MNILVCIKQVPDTTEIKIDPVTNTLIRDGVESIVNTFDSYALEMAARIKDVTPNTRITLVSMGPPQAIVALRECLSKGGDTAYLISDRKFGGADTLATSFTLTHAIKRIEEIQNCKFDLIFCGKQAIDGDTAQVGPEIAEHLDYPQVTYAVEAEMKDGKVVVKRETESGYELLEVNTPCVITVTKPRFNPRMATLLSKIAAMRQEVKILGADELRLSDSTEIGLKGSPTRVKKTFTPPLKQGGVKFKEATERESVAKLIAALQKDAVLV